MAAEKRNIFGKGKKRILIVEDHPIFRLGMSELINEEDDLVVCGDADDVGNAWNAIRELKPDLVIVDITLKSSDGIELVKEINRHCRGLPVLVLSMHDESLYAERALLAGARGYIMKQEAMEFVVKAIHHVLDGKVYASERVKENILQKIIDQPYTNNKSPVYKLTNRELEVFQLIGQGLTTKEIAGRLNLSVKTIGTYRERIKEKLNLKHAAELVRYAVHWAQTGNIEIVPEK